MDIQHKITSFAALGAPMVSWVLTGFAVGGLAMAIDHAVSLVRGGIGAPAVPSLTLAPGDARPDLRAAGRPGATVL